IHTVKTLIYRVEAAIDLFAKGHGLVAHFAKEAQRVIIRFVSHSSLCLFRAFEASHPSAKCAPNPFHFAVAGAPFIYYLWLLVLRPHRTFYPIVKNCHE